MLCTYCMLICKNSRRTRTSKSAVFQRRTIDKAYWYTRIHNSRYVLGVYLAFCVNLSCCCSGFVVCWYCADHWSWSISETRPPICCHASLHCIHAFWDSGGVFFCLRVNSTDGCFFSTLWKSQLFVLPEVYTSIMRQHNISFLTPTLLPLPPIP